MEIVKFNLEKDHKITKVGGRDVRFKDEKFLIGRIIKIKSLTIQMGRCITGWVIFQDNLKGNSLYKKGQEAFFASLELEKVSEK